VALARKLAVVLHRMLADGTTFVADKAAARAAAQEGGNRVRAAKDTTCPGEVPVAGTMDQVRPQPTTRRRKADRAP
jgi:hypothetical protein